MSCLHRFIDLLWVCWTKPYEHWLWCCNLDSFWFQSCTSRYNAGTWGIVQGQLRPLLAPRVYTLPMVRSIGKTMVQGKNYGPQITVKRISTRSVMFRIVARTLVTHLIPNLCLLFIRCRILYILYILYLNFNFNFFSVFSEGGSVNPSLCRLLGRLWNWTHLIWGCRHEPGKSSSWGKGQMMLEGCLTTQSQRCARYGDPDCDLYNVGLLKIMLISVI